MGESDQVKENIVKVCIAIPNNGYTQPESYENRLLNFLYLGGLQERGRYEKHNPRFEFYFVVEGRLFTPLAREEAARFALEGNMDYLFFIDDDMISPNNLFEMLYRHNVDICGALAFTRNPPHKPVIYSCIEGWDAVKKQDYFVNHYVWNYPKDKLVECDAMGFGSVLIKMDVFRKMPRPWFALCSNTGEDILFCYNAKKYGFRVFVDTSAKIGHLGNPINVTEEYAMKWWKNNGLEIEKSNSLYKKYDAKNLDPLEAVYSK